MSFFYAIWQKGEIFVPKKLNDTQIAELIMKYTNGTSISALAKEYKIDWTTCKRYIKNAKEMQEECQAIKNETITEWLKAHSSKIQELLDLCVDLLPKKLNQATARDIIGAYKVLTETSINNVESKQNPNNAKTSLDALCEAINKVAENG